MVKKSEHIHPHTCTRNHSAGFWESLKMSCAVERFCVYADYIHKNIYGEAGEIRMGMGERGPVLGRT